MMIDCIGDSTIGIRHWISENSFNFKSIGVYVYAIITNCKLHKSCYAFRTSVYTCSAPYGKRKLDLANSNLYTKLCLGSQVALLRVVLRQVVLRQVVAHQVGNHILRR